MKSYVCSSGTRQSSDKPLERPSEVWPLPLRGVLFALLAVVALSFDAPALAAESDANALAIFTKRIVPILQAKNPSSCSECHLSGVDLKDYIRPTQEATFAALLREGLIDRQSPDDSKLLRFIRRKPAKPSLVTEKIRAQEVEAFRAWIFAAVKDPKLSASKASPKESMVPIGPQVPPEVIRHARADRVLQSFIDNVWSEVGRCAACHSPDRNQQQVKKHGEQVSWITLRDPQATLRHLVENELIDAKSPEKSLILRKPTLQVDHGGGQKMLIGDRTYQQFRRFLDDYAATSQAKYRAAADLPPPSPEKGYTTEIWFKLTGVPAKFDKMLLQVDLHRWEGNGWSKDRWATSDRAVFGKGNLWQHSLSLVAPRESPRAATLTSGVLPPGKYLAKIYVDQQDHVAKYPDGRLPESDFVGQVEVDSRWPAGYGAMTSARYPEK